MPRYVVIGAGAVGVSLAAELKRAGNGVVLIGRGAMLAAARDGGVTYVRPDGARQLDVPVLGSPEEIELTGEDILVLTTKTQDAAAALELWAAQPVTRTDGSRGRAGEALALVTTQNGLETERLALRHFALVIGGVLGIPAHFVEPGVVVAAGVPAVGAAWIGAYPDRGLPLVEELARAFRRANFSASAVSDISAWKRAKLVASATFALDALYPPSELRDRAAGLIRAETQAVLSADGPLADIAGSFAAKGGITAAPVPGYAYGGTSTWQSLARASSLETDYINGEVVLQARLHGLQAPANQALVDQIRDAVANASEPRSFTDTDLVAAFPSLVGAAPETSAGVDESRARVLITPAALASELAGVRRPALLDVRWKLGDTHGREHFAAGHIPGAVYVDLDTELAARGAPTDGRHPLPDLEDLQASARDWGVHQDQPVVVYDDNGGTSAARAWWLLRWAGVTDVRILDGGLGAWTGAGRSLEHGAMPATGGGDVTLSAGHLTTLNADEVAAFPAEGVLLDARAGERYRGEVEPIDPRAGHIPGAVSAPTTDNLSAGRFLDATALAARFTALGVDGETPVGVYCGSGVTAAHAVAALASLGIDAALYPGSWSAWSNDPDRPVATGADPGWSENESTTHRSASYAG